MTTDVAHGVASLAEMMARVEADLQAEIALMDAQIEESRRLRSASSLLSSASPSPDRDWAPAGGNAAEDAEAEEIVRQFIDLINRAADAYNAGEAAASETFAETSAQAAGAIEALRENEAQLPARSGTTAPVTPRASGLASASSPPLPPPTDTSTTDASPAKDTAASGAAEGAAVEGDGASSPLATPPPAAALTKGGMLLNYGKDRFMRSFQNHWVVVSDGEGRGPSGRQEVAGVAWYDSEAAYRKGSAPIDSIPFFAVEKNSRGSLFKKASVCWPLVTDEDCPKLSAADKSKTYFAVDYANPKSGKMDLIVLGAASDAERDEWVTFITRFLVLYLPPGEEFEPFINFPVGANPPLHVSQVLGGEAPGSAQRVIDPTMRR